MLVVEVGVVGIGVVDEVMCVVVVVVVVVDPEDNDSLNLLQIECLLEVQRKSSYFNTCFFSPPLHCLDSGVQKNSKMPCF